jgi:proline dehydrogenase
MFAHHRLFLSASRSLSSSAVEVVQKAWSPSNALRYNENALRELLRPREDHQVPPLDHVPLLPKKIAMPNFSSSEYMSQKTNAALIQSSLVFKLCQVPFFVHYGEKLLEYMRKGIGDTLTDALVKNTFFRQFCGGETSSEVQRTIQELKKSNMNVILDYAAENATAPDEDLCSYESTEGIFNQPARQYIYEDETVCDEHTRTFLDCIRTASEVSSTGFVAVKVTALGDPRLLRRISQAIQEATRIFQDIDSDNDGIISTSDFIQGYRQNFNDTNANISLLLNILDPSNCGEITFEMWRRLFTPSYLPLISTKTALSETESKSMSALETRMLTICQEAFNHGVRVSIDAEQSWFQTAIDNYAILCQQIFNAKDKTDHPIIYQTYQCYLKDSYQRVQMDYERSKHLDYHFAAKLVRGAYMVKERQVAESRGYDSPIHESFQDTSRCYDQSVDFLMRHKVYDNSSLEIMCATHNEDSIKHTISLMEELGLRDDQCRDISFAQLYGMSDNLTYPLAAENYQTYKYLPYGRVQEVIPYLLRRAQENGDVLGKSAIEGKANITELKKRLLQFFR